MKQPPSPNLWTCDDCGEPLEPGELAQADRGTSWRLRCSSCSEILSEDGTPRPPPAIAVAILALALLGVLLLWGLWASAAAPDEVGSSSAWEEESPR